MFNRYTLTSAVAASVSNSAIHARLEQGASVVVTLDGAPVVDLWAGDADDQGRPWERDTIVNVYSTTKTMAATCMLLLYDATTGTCRVAGAGHPAPILVRPGGKAHEVCLPPGQPLGQAQVPAPVTEEELPESSVVTITRTESIQDYFARLSGACLLLLCRPRRCSSVMRRRLAHAQP